MHNIVSSVFKVVGLSLILMLVLQVALFLLDVSNCTTRIQSVVGLMSTEVARNNCLLGVTETTATSTTNNTFAQLLEKAVDGSEYFKYNHSKNSDVFKDLSETNIKQYGDIAEIKIVYDLQPFWVNTDDTVIAGALNQSSTIEITFESTVPCLRYIK